MKTQCLFNKLENARALYVNGSLTDDFGINIGGEIGNVLEISYTNKDGNQVDYYIEENDIEKIMIDNGFIFLVVNKTDIVIKPLVEMDLKN